MPQLLPTLTLEAHPLIYFLPAACPLFLPGKENHLCLPGSQFNVECSSYFTLFREPPHVVHQNCGNFVQSKAAIYLSFTKTVFSHISYLQISKYPLVRTGFSFYSENTVTEFHRPGVRVPFAHLHHWGGRILGKTHPLVLCSGLLIWAVNSFLSFATSQNAVGNSRLLSAIKSLKFRISPLLLWHQGRN